MAVTEVGSRSDNPLALPEGLRYSQIAVDMFRKQLVHQLGEDLARVIVAQAGRHGGFNDAQVLLQEEKFERIDEMVMAQYRSLRASGFGSFDVSEIAVERVAKEAYIRVACRNSPEAESHLRLFGRATLPACWHLVGYSTGWLSAMTGLPLLTVESRCRAKGDPHCEFETLPYADFVGPEAAFWKRAFESTSTSLALQLEVKTRELTSLLAQMKQQARALRSQEAATLIAQSLSLEAAAPGVLESLGTQLGWDVAAAWLVDTRADALRCVATWSTRTARAPQFEEATRQLTTMSADELPQHIWRTGRSEYVADLARAATGARRAAAAADRLRTAYAFPIRVGAEVVGVIELYSRSSTAIDEESFATLDAVGSQIGTVLQHKRAQEALRDRDLQLALRIQSSILPQQPQVTGLEIAGTMIAAEDVGGDYYDVIPCADGCWVGIGDVSGHGLGAGLIMLMVQSGVSALVRAAPDASPREHIAPLNAFLYDNIRQRLHGDDHVTFSLLRYRTDGSIVWAGAHEEMIIWRAANRKCELISALGPWLGAVARLARPAPEGTTRLQPGDVLVLYSDGIIEAMNTERRFFGVERLMAILEEAADAPTETICRNVVASARAWTSVQKDDMSLLVMRYRGPSE